MRGLSFLWSSFRGSLSVILGVVAVIMAATYFQFNGVVGANNLPQTPIAFTEQVFITGQISLNDTALQATSPYKTIIDLRPDGEEVDQPASSAVEKLAISGGKKFLYLPTLQGAITEDQVSRLGHALKTLPGPFLLYCRSGNRAARVWALAEASNPAGFSAQEIIGKLEAQGFHTNDLVERIATAVEARGTVKP